MKLMVLGSGQDGGVPQIGCYCENCKDARRYKSRRRLAPCIAINDDEHCIIIDASPDLKEQLHMLNKKVSKVKRAGKLPITAILLTHAHMGHIMGLVHLGKESINEMNLPVYTTPKMEKVLKSSHPFSRLVKNRNIVIKTTRPGRGFDIESFKFDTFAAPHRNEVSDTVGYVIHSKKKVLYLPDTDRWDKSILKRIEDVDIAIIDGTFYSKEELPRYIKVPHPPIIETMKSLRDMDTRVYFTHLNHTNVLNVRGKELLELEKKGFNVACDGMTLTI